MPVLRRFEAPAIFFVSSRHLDGGGLLWFRYLEMLEHYFPEDRLELHGEVYSLHPSDKQDSLRRLRDYLLALRPHPGELYRVMEQDMPAAVDFAPKEALTDHAAGMTREQLRELANDPLFIVGGHTIDHPILPLCTLDEARRQLDENKRLLEQVTGQACDTFAHPLGKYDKPVLELCEELGFRSGFGVFGNPHGDRWSHLTLERIGIYKGSTLGLLAKAYAGARMRAMGLQFG
jgi:peptidoglycan/xylan/chitin deacetylase (PgdA/CDA1 family)